MRNIINNTTSETTLAKYTIELVHEAVKMLSNTTEGHSEGTLVYKEENNFFGSMCQWHAEDEDQFINLAIKMLNRRRYGNKRVRQADWNFYNRIIPSLNRNCRV